jgi:hypothetical protein
VDRRDQIREAVAVGVDPAIREVGAERVGRAAASSRWALGTVGIAIGARVQRVAAGGAARAVVTESERVVGVAERRDLAVERAPLVVRRADLRGVRARHERRILSAAPLEPRQLDRLRVGELQQAGRRVRPSVAPPLRTADPVCVGGRPIAHAIGQPVPVEIHEHLLEARPAIVETPEAPGEVPGPTRGEEPWCSLRLRGVQVDARIAVLERYGW